MSTATSGLDAQLQDYLVGNTLREHTALAALRAKTDEMAYAVMRSSPEQMQFLQLLLKLIEAREVLEVGCFVGYGTLAMALALPEDGRVTTIDVNEDWAATGRDYWRQAGVETKIEFRTGEAASVLDALLKQGDAGRFDFAYIDADKKGYPGYFAQCLELVRPGGLIALDNMLWQGAVADPSNQDRQTVILRDLTHQLRENDAIDFSLVPIGDGVALARRRA
ncbi:MAG: class I SAM-dependent methyltransferase [Pseudomonadota bacterium]